MFGHRWFFKLGELSDASLMGLTSQASELLDCNYSLYQGIDHKGQGSTNVRMSDIVCTYDGLPSQDMIKWALTHNSYQNGTLILCDSSDVPVTKLHFEEAACVGLKISYHSAGSSSILTQIRIQPHKFKTDVATLEQPWTNLDSSQSGSSSGAAPKIAQPIGKTTLDLTFDGGGQTYEIEAFKVSFWQGSDHKGQPQEEVGGGIIHFSISGLPDKTFQEWMMKSEALKSGVFSFRQGDVSNPLDIKFSNAYCINMLNAQGMGGSMETHFVISADEVDLNGKWIYKRFKL